MNLLLKNCKILVNGKEFLKQIAIVDGKIEKITSMNYNIISDAKTEVIDIGGKYVIPGAIDAHVHFREPGMEHKEDFYTGSKAAAKGGITTFIDMPNTKPPTITVEALDEKRKLARKSVTNFGFHFGASVDNNIEEIKNAQNIASVKVFMNVSTGKMLIEDEELLKDVFRNAKFVSVHAEGDMVTKAIKFNKDYGHGLYLCHVTLKSEIAAIRSAKDEGEKVYAEVAPHHLFLSEEDDKSAFTKMLPSLKSKKDQEALWEAIDEGIVDTIGTDHAPHRSEEKNQQEFPYGVPGVETMLPLLFDAVNKGRLTLDRVIELCCNNPAKIFKIKNKGFLKEEYDADLVVVDMDLEKEVNGGEIISKCKWSPFTGRKLKGWPIMTIVGGNVVFKNNKVSIDHLGKEVEFE